MKKSKSYKRCRFAYHIFICTLCKDEAIPLPLEVVEEAPIGHVGHHDVGGGACVITHTNETHHVGMIEPAHLHTFVYNLINFQLVKSTWEKNEIL